MSDSDPPWPPGRQWPPCCFHCGVEIVCELATTTVTTTIQPDLHVEVTGLFKGRHDCMKEGPLSQSGT